MGTHTHWTTDHGSLCLHFRLGALLVGFRNKHTSVAVVCKGIDSSISSQQMNLQFLLHNIEYAVYYQICYNSDFHHGKMAFRHFEHYYSDGTFTGSTRRIHKRTLALYNAKWIKRIFSVRRSQQFKDVAKELGQLLNI